MCWNGKCFNFEDYRNKKVAVVISGPGYLEFSWALETVSYLKEFGANVSLLDFSDYGSVYSLRLDYFGFRLPSIFRKLLRNALLEKNERIENRVAQVAKALNVRFFKFHFLSVKCFLPGLRRIPISEFQGQQWGRFSATDILISLFSSFDRKLLSFESRINKGIAMQTKEVLEEIDVELNDPFFEEFYSVFLANGRQPVQAALTAGLRKRGTQVILYEAGGGHIFPGRLQKRISYYFTSTSNPVELQEKLICAESKATDEVRMRAVELLGWLHGREDAPFGIDFVPRSTSSEKIHLEQSSRNMAYFTSSDWENSVLLNTDEYKTRSTSFSSQIEAVRVLISELGDKDNLFIRLHPSDPGKVAEAEEYWFDLESNPKVTVIPSNSQLDSYQLANAVSLSFVWNSTIGLELAMRGLRVAVLGDAAYAPSFESSWLRNRNDLKNWMSSPKIIELKNLQSFGIYFGFGGFLLRLSGVDSDGNRLISKHKIDVPKAPLAHILPKLLRAIS